MLFSSTLSLLQLKVPFFIWVENKECDKSAEATCTKMITIQFSEGDDAQIIKYV